ncbi:hypothetical protein SAY86_003825 [Trapa natans]|uniref:Uncharacterized protein n=1 Tax=Trapa natans TaxID=22666 RepID=A0AAN7N518_TRANT|nr:hypothetical protein SAY86_003825 [Trapa natans]
MKRPPQNTPDSTKNDDSTRFPTTTNTKAPVMMISQCSPSDAFTPDCPLSQICMTQLPNTDADTGTPKDSTMLQYPPSDSAPVSDLSGPVNVRISTPARPHWGDDGVRSKYEILTIRLDSSSRGN